MLNKFVVRCPLKFWGKCSDKNFNIMQKYHDFRWCKPIHNDVELFAMLSLEIMQAGLSWQTILDKEKNIREAFDNFQIETVANYDKNKIEKLLKNEKIVKNKLKIQSIINNAQIILKLKTKFQSFNNYIWQFSNYKTIDNRITNFEEMVSYNNLSKKISTNLKNLNFKFVGPTIVYSYMQSIGIVNNHIITCSFR